MQRTVASGEEISHTQREMFPKTLTLQLDFDKTLKTPKVSSQDSYFCAKLKTHYLGMYCASDDYIYCFLFDETVGSMGPNEVISLLDHLVNLRISSENMTTSLFGVIMPLAVQRMLLVLLPRLYSTTWAVPEGRPEISVRRSHLLCL